MDEIERLELQIEELRDAIERSRRFALAGRASVVAGPALLAAILIGLVAFTPARPSSPSLSPSAEWFSRARAGPPPRNSARALSRVEAARNAAIDGLDLANPGGN